MTIDALSVYAGFLCLVLFTWSGLAMNRRIDHLEQQAREQSRLRHPSSRGVLTCNECGYLLRGPEVGHIHGGAR